MELVLTIIAGIGILLFVLGYLSYLISGFKHHFVTGLITVLPVLNIVTLPALWQKARKKFFMGFIGLAMFLTSWFLGADKGLKSLFANNNHDELVFESSPVVTSAKTIPLSLPKKQGQETIKDANKNTNSSMIKTPVNRPFLNETKLVDLPIKALYKLMFESAPLDEIPNLVNRIVRIKIEAGQLHEGRIINVNANTVLLRSGSKEQTFPIADIQQLQIMVKK